LIRWRRAAIDYLHWRRAVYLPPEPLHALSLPAQRSQRRNRPFTAGRTAALFVTITIMDVAIVLGVAHDPSPVVTLSSIF